MVACRFYYYIITVCPQKNGPTKYYGLVI